MKTVFVMNGISMQDGKPGVSGGDIRLIEIASYWAKHNKVYLITSESGKILCEKMGLDVEFHITPSSEGAGIGENIKRVFNSLYSVINYKEKIDVAYSSCEHLYDVLPSFILKYRNNAKWVAVVHWVEEAPWKDTRGKTPFLSRYLYYFNRVISVWLIRNFADKTFAVSHVTTQKLLSKKKFTGDKIQTVACGVDFQHIQEITSSNLTYGLEKKYDAIFIKRLNYGKGIIDLIDIWKKIVDEKSDAKLAVIGDGSKEVIQKLNNQIKEHHLERNIIFLGVIYDHQEKFTYLQQSKLFILPSYEENWAIVIGEAMATGVPVIAYNLKEITPIWEDNVTWVEKGDSEEFAETVLKMLNNDSDREKKSKKALDFVKQYEWSEIARNELETSQTLIN